MGIQWGRVAAGAFATGAEALVKNKEKYEERQKELADQSFAANQKYFDAKVSFANERRKQRDAQKKDVRTAVDTVSQTLQTKYGLSANASLNYAAQLLADSPTIESATFKSKQLSDAAEQANNDPIRKAEILQRMNFKDTDANLTLLEATNALTEGLYGKPYQLEAPTPEITTTSYWGATKQDKRAGIQKKQFEQIAGLYNEGIQRNTREVNIPAFTGTMPQTLVARDPEAALNLAHAALQAAKSEEEVALRMQELRDAEDVVSRRAALKREASTGLTSTEFSSFYKQAISLKPEEYFGTDPSRIAVGNFTVNIEESRLAQGQEALFRNYSSVKEMGDIAGRDKALNEFMVTAAPAGAIATPEEGESARVAIARQYEEIYEMRLGLKTLQSWEERFKTSYKVYQKDPSKVDSRMRRHLDAIYKDTRFVLKDNKRVEVPNTQEDKDNYLGTILKKAFFIPTGGDVASLNNFKKNLGLPIPLLVDNN